MKLVFLCVAFVSLCSAFAYGTNCSHVNPSLLKESVHRFILDNGVIQKSDEGEFGATRIVYEPVKLVRHGRLTLVGIHEINYTKNDDGTETRTEGPGVDAVVLTSCKKRNFKYKTFETAVKAPSSLIAEVGDPTHTELGKAYVKFVGPAVFPVLKSWYTKNQNSLAFHGVVLPLESTESLPPYDSTPNRRWKIVDSELILHTAQTPEGCNVYPWEFDKDLTGNLSTMPDMASKPDGEGHGKRGGNVWPVGFVLLKVKPGA